MNNIETVSGNDCSHDARNRGHQMKWSDS